ncbi:MAG: formylglycine-generating enzyme family protein [Planctomycetota bacterium]|jgi:formylglycine-generating enzyme required for sulfatase activity
MVKHGSFRMAAPILAFLSIFVFTDNTVLAECPSADYSGGCFVDYEDFGLMRGQWLDGYDSNDLAEMAKQWLTTDPCIPDDMAYIPGGGFEMGDHFDPEGYDNELPVHSVLLDAFFMSKFEITNQQYCDYLNSALGSGSIYLSSDVVYGTGNNQPYCDTSASHFYGLIVYGSGVFSVRTMNGRDRSDDPMVMVSWYGAAAYCNWRSSAKGYESCFDTNDPNWTCDFTKTGYRLPTEAEWEYAARGGQHYPYYRYPWDNSIEPNQANYTISGDPYDTATNLLMTAPVGFFDGTTKYKADYNWPASVTSYQTTSGANGYGLYDMAGNVWERCNDRYDENYYNVSPYDNPEGPVSGIFRVYRGGCWNNIMRGCRVAARNYSYPEHRDYGVGFRIVLKLE